MSNTRAEIYFYDGPLRGTYKYVDIEEVRQRNTYKVYVPIPSLASKSALDGNVYTTVKCIEAVYRILPLPNFRSNDNRFILLEEPPQ